LVSWFGGSVRWFAGTETTVMANVRLSAKDAIMMADACFSAMVTVAAALLLFPSKPWWQLLYIAGTCSQAV